ncbi:12360_t:CDS:2 [Dentiscutata erythropus]|uniref:12360_t:CDS:1 n=1 Tax=Dentiscutata erythropus TaxID=1348616 RepID=A0A9N9F2E3_9GLOM|nr:12360_t:CDS:2 [Dentiscutata erythropus]
MIWKFAIYYQFCYISKTTDWVSLDVTETTTDQSEESLSTSH